ncbi:MAG TPA: YhbY family RNA-binding protein [Gemmatimonadaceae bacterium]|nr:YhbY family RNA-binding protein [Gemmatimonadaceae bacterium]
MTLTSKRRAELRAEAHHLQSAVHIGQQGVTPALVQTLDDTLRTRELVKIQLGRNAELDVRDAARQLAEATGADVVQVIGRTTTLYRENPELRGTRDSGIGNR